MMRRQTPSRKARFVLSHRKSGPDRQRLSGALQASMIKLASAMPLAEIVDVTESRRDTGRSTVIFESDLETAEDMKRSLPDNAILEPEIYYYAEMDRPPGIRVHRPGKSTDPDSAASAAISAAPLTPFDVQVSGGGAPLSGAKVVAWIDQPGRSARPLTDRSDAKGCVRFHVPVTQRVLYVTVLPATAYWRMCADAPESPVSIDCPALPMPGPYGWWHVASVRASANTTGLGTGVRIGVVDTGCGPHKNLAHISLVGACVGGRKILSSGVGQDIERHGTHVCGAIGGAISATSDFIGIATKADIYAMRVFSQLEVPANQADIASAIETLSSDYELDLINLSLSAADRSEVLLDEIQAALDRGVLCICAAGNEGSAVAYPARHPECVAVSALGRVGNYPAGTLSAAQIPTDPSRFGHNDLFLATFSSFGDELTVSAPGVGIIAPVPTPGNPLGGYADMDGTSMATPVVCGNLATLLAQDASYLSMPRDAARATRARQILTGAAIDIALPCRYQGAGVVLI
jgi:hypothetical protein